MNLILHFAESNASDPVKGVANKKEKKPPVPDTASNSAANDNTSNKQDETTKHPPDMGSDVMPNETNSSLNQPKPVPKEVVPETVKNGAANNTNTSNNSPKPSDPELKPKPEEPQSVEATKSLNPSPPAPPMPQCRTRAEWQKSNCSITSLSTIIALFTICTELAD